MNKPSEIGLDTFRPWRQGTPRLLITFPLLLLVACSEDDPKPTQLDGRIQPDALVTKDNGPATDGKADGKLTCTDHWQLPHVQGNNSTCKPAVDDFQPGSATDGWDPCISDNNAYEPFDANISSIARVAAFEQIATLLLTATPAEAQKFIDAKLAYTQPEGLDSRVSRREDEHYPQASKACADMDATEIQANKDRCVGQAQIQPLLNSAFAEGAAGKDVLLNAARIESALLWFLYISVYKEATTCMAKKKDCDSSYAYYTGGEARSGGLGLARYVRAVSDQTHDRVWDGILAVRCWRDLDGEETATNTTLRDRALQQMDRALLRGLALILKSRLLAFETACDEFRLPLWASIQILGNVLDREATVHDATKAASLRQELSKSDPATAALNTINQLLDELFPCP